MLLQDLMQAPVHTVTADQSLAAVYAFMQEQRVRHLPVLQDDRLVGVITDRDLRLATSHLRSDPFDPSAATADVMSQPPQTAGPLDPIEEAARLMRQHAIGCLPVMDGEALVGIVTGTDLLDALMRLTGITKPGGRLEVRLPDEPGQLARLTATVAREGGNIRSVLSYSESVEALRVLFQVDTIKTRALARALHAEGVEVLWPPIAPPTA
ncbi:MAG: CBS domain-containing protein [Bacteroidetes bacterium]|jgi:acetoin utilization protein AcuB|nr:CBS domain-containing protein [Bacteroidota bacterium]